MTRKFGIWATLPGLIALGLSGCGFEPAYFAPTAAQVVLLDVPMGILGDLEHEIQEAGTSISVTLLRVGQSGSSYSEDDLLTGATVSLHFLDNPGEAARSLSGEVFLEIPESTDYPGVYFLNSSMDERLTYNPGVQYRVSIEHGGESYELCMNSAPITTMQSPIWADYVTPGEDVPIAYGPEAALPFVASFDSSGSLTYTNFPLEPSALYGWLSSPSSTDAVVPGSALAKEDLYGLAVAGMRVADWPTGGSPSEELHYISNNLNPLGSVFLSGSAAVTSITTIPLDFLQGQMTGLSDEDAEVVTIDLESWSIDPLDYAMGSVDIQPSVESSVWIMTPTGQKVDLTQVPNRPGSFTLAQADSRMLYDSAGIYTLHLIDRYQNERHFAFRPQSKVDIHTPEGLDHFEIVEGEGLQINWSPKTAAADIRVYAMDGSEVYATTIGGDTALEPGSVPKENEASVTLPPEAFPKGAAYYQIGILGLSASEVTGDVYGINTDFSTMLSGRTVTTWVDVQAPALP